MASNADQDNGADTMRSRVPGSRLKLWLLLEANRWVLAGVVLAGLFLTFVVLGHFDPVSLGSALTSTDPIDTLFQALTTAIITGVTLVVTINQLVLSQELGPLGDQRDRMEGALSFRQDLASTLSVGVVPAEPSAFLGALVDAAAARSETLAAAATESSDPQAREEIQSLTAEIRQNADGVSQQLDGAQFGTFAVVSAALNFNYSVKIYEARRIRAEHGDALPDDVTNALDELLELLELFGPAREHVKTLYFQWELIDLSRVLLYTALPALAVSVAMIVYVDDGASVAWTVLGVDGIVWLTSAATVVALTPFVLLVAYILRIATVAKRTLAIGPFVLREMDSNA
ncbi:hypothetical protein ACFR9U_01950 [Halorientalis brevis]|uniref:Uncharacterized protein n=1 Tax=Halorientalis brevis TaxID=1126241 RepID=A0ABD6C606_9EURY|nr:hypothetical protein [Halorientalis brevis]